MLQTIESINNAVNNFIWGVPAMICIIGVGLYLSLRTGFIQIRKFPYALKTTLGRIFKKKEASDGSMTPFQAVCTALAGTVGTGNIAGVAGAIAIGGPGAVFWMWISAILGMCTKFTEVTLAVHFRERNKKGDYVGGPMYYIKNGLSKKWQILAILYSAFGVLTVFGTGNATQVNTITTAIDTALINFNIIPESASKTLNLVLGIVIMLLVGMVLLGGIKRIGSVSEKLVPFMALLYIVLAIGVVVLNFERVPAVFHDIVYGAFNPAAVTGGVIGSFFLSLASASNAIIIGFNVRPDATAKATAEREGVDVRLYRVIYDAIADVEAAMKGMLDPIFEEKVIGHAEVRQLFKASGVGTIAGSYVLDGTFQRGCSVRITREGTQIFEGPLASLKRFKDDVKEVRAGYECGLVFEKFNDVHELDQVEAYIMVEVPR